MQRWSRRHAACLNCNSTAVAHMAHGLCKRCYSAHYASAHYARVAEQKNEWYIRNGGKVAAKVQREQRHYSGLRQPVLERDGHACVICGALTQLVVHHKDGRGRGHPYPNNRMSNLETRCRKCHITHHRPELLTARGLKALLHWSPRYGLSCCRRCHRSDIKHNSHGLCANCYARARRAR